MLQWTFLRTLVVNFGFPFVYIYFYRSCLVPQCCDDGVACTLNQTTVKSKFGALQCSFNYLQKQKMCFICPFPGFGSNLAHKTSQSASIWSNRRRLNLLSLWQHGTAFRSLVCIFTLNTYFRRVRFDCLDSFGWNLSTMVLKMANHVNDAMQEVSLAWINVQIDSGLGVECLLKDVFVAANVSFWREFLLYSWLILVGEGMTNTITAVNLAKVRRMNTQKLPSSPWDSALPIFATGLRSERTRDQEGMGWFKQNAEMLLFFRKLMWVLRSHVFFVNTDTIHLYMLLPIS